MTDLITLRTRACLGCGSTTTFQVRLEQLEAYNKGALAQEAFPELSPEDRERLISGTCPACWDKMFRARSPERMLD